MDKNFKLRPLLTELGIIDGNESSPKPESVDEVVKILGNHGLEVNRIYERGEKILPVIGSLYIPCDGQEIEVLLPIDTFPDLGKNLILTRVLRVLHLHGY